MVPRVRIELTTPRVSVACSTNGAISARPPGQFSRNRPSVQNPLATPEPHAPAPVAGEERARAVSGPREERSATRKAGSKDQTASVNEEAPDFPKGNYASRLACAAARLAARIARAFTR